MAVDPAAPDKSDESWTQRQRRRAQDSVERAQSWAKSARNHSAPVDAALTLIGRVRFVQLTLVTGYLAMRFFILIFPLAYVLVAGIGLTTSSDEAQNTAQDIGIGSSVASSISDAAAGSSRGHWLALIVGLMATAWAGRGALKAMRITHAEAWRLPIPKTGYTSFGGLPLAGIVVVLLAYSSWVTHLREEGYSVVVVFLMHAAVLGAVCLGISWLMPRAGGTSWKDLLPGALLFALAGPALNIAMAVYFTPKVARTQATYGALGVGVVLLTYLLVLAWLVAGSAELNSGLYAWREERRAASPGGE
jgi:uncharacterized BrkB/YihY/UPF0761 family membrane protein